MPVVGAFVSIVIVKELFGGIGRNFANPAIVGRMVLAVSFTSRMTAFPFPNTLSGVDALTSATPCRRRQRQPSCPIWICCWAPMGRAG